MFIKNSAGLHVYVAISLEVPSHLSISLGILQIYRQSDLKTMFNILFLVHHFFSESGSGSSTSIQIVLFNGF